VTGLESKVPARHQLEALYPWPVDRLRRKLVFEYIETEVTTNCVTTPSVSVTSPCRRARGAQFVEHGRTPVGST